MTFLAFQDRVEASTCMS